MKPKRTRFQRVIFPSLVILPAMVQFASAAIITPDGFGNVLITTNDSGADHIRIPAGQPAGLHEIRFDPNTFLTPDGAASIDLRVLDGAGASYKINMAAGSSIDGGANAGITTANAGGVAADLFVDAAGSITGATGIEGGLGQITVLNNSVITGTAGAGIDSTGTILLTNNLGSDVTGSVDGVIATGDGSIVDNYGTITGQAGDGVIVGDNAIINNLTSFNTTPIFGGQIIGSDDGVIAGDNLTLVNQNLGSITGSGDDGINAGENANITNALGASITGVNGDGINAENGATIINHGTITGGDDGIDIDGFVASNSIIVNTGTITGGTGSAIDGSNSVEELTNSGRINGGTANAIDLMGGDDIVNLNLGSRVIGDVIGGTGINTLNFGAGITSPGGIGNSISGNVTEFDSINKTSGGVAVIGTLGNPLYNVTADSINITDGGLYINANIAGHTVAQSTINAGGAALGGTGTWNADVNITGTGGFSAGSIPINLTSNPLNAIGTVRIKGDVVHAPTSFIRYDFAPQGGPGDRIVQTGAGNTYNMGGGYVRLSATDNNRVLRDGSYVIVQSDRTILGSVQATPTVQFNDNVSANDTGFIGSQVLVGGANNSDTVLGGIFSTVKLDGKKVVLTVEHDFEGLNGLSSNAAALGGALDGSLNSPDAVAQDFIAALDYSDLSTVQSTLNGLAPDTTFATIVAIASGNYRLHRLVQDHLALTRSGGDTMRQQVGSYSGPAPAPQTYNSGMGNAWGTASYAWKDVDNDTSKNFDGGEASFTAGVDYRVTPDFLVGIVLDGSTADYDYRGGSSDVDSFRAAIYGTYGQATGFYSDFLVGYGYHNLDQDRYAGPLLGNLSSDTDANNFQAMLTAGYAMQHDCVKHGPFLGLEYQYIDVDGYNQRGPFPVSVNGYDVDSFRLFGGYRVEATYDKFTPYASVAYAHEFEDDRNNTTAQISGGQRFGVSGNGLESAILISVGTNYNFTQELSMNVGYYGELSTQSDGVDSNGISVGMNYEF